MSTQASEAPAAPATAPAVCGHTVNTAKGPKPCQKPPGHDTEGTPAFEQYGKGHASRIQTRKDYKPVSKASLNSFADVPDDVEVEYGGGSKETDRTKMFGGLQPTVDEHVKASYQKWVAAGKPKEFNASPRSRYVFPANEEDTFRAMLRAAGRFHGVSVKMPSKSAAHQNGKRILYWVAVDTKPRDKESGEQRVEGEAAPVTT